MPGGLPIDLELPAPITGIICHAWNKDRSLLATARNNDNNIHIYSLDGMKLTLHTILKGHYGLVTGLDWSTHNDRLASCGQDRNVFIWKPMPCVDSSSQEYRPSPWTSTLVMTRLGRACTCIQWSPKEDKLAIGSSESVVAICYYDSEDSFWKSKHLAVQSSTLCLSWHPNNVLLAIGDTGCRAVILSAYIKGIDERPPANPWGDKLPFGTICADFSGEGWVQAISFSPSGNSVAWTCRYASLHGTTTAADKMKPIIVSIDASKTTHDSIASRTLLHIADPKSSALHSISVPSMLPFKQILFHRENQMIIGGYDYCLYVFDQMPSSAKSLTW